MCVHLLAVQRVAFLFDRYQRQELIRPNLVEADPDAHFQRCPEIERAP
jgi:hypothetical protein